MVMVNDDFEAIEVTYTVVRLMRGGQPIVDSNGRPKDYATMEEAVHVARNWHEFRMPTFDELRSMTDAELLARHRRLVELEANRPPGGAPK